MNIVLLSCYEQGQQSLNLASPLAALRQAGFNVEAFDLAIQKFPESSVAHSTLVAISTPMHTALRLAVSVARQVRSLNSEAHICFYGSYAWMNRDLLLTEPTSGRRPVADSVIGGEFEQPLVRLATSLERGQSMSTASGVLTERSDVQPYLQRTRVPLPDRSSLPHLSQYAHLVLNGRQLAAGYTESSRGCLHLCRHCPVVPVYGGRFFVISAETVLEDIRQQVESGAQHVTFGDPDFLNGPGHALKIARLLHRDHPSLTFDFTTKVEHIIENRPIMSELKDLGAAFVISAFESTSDRVLARLHKGHTLANMNQALEILDEAALPVQATWVPFTPWTSLDDYLHMLDWISSQGLIQHVAAVQLSIRLLVPPGSALLEHDDRDQWLGTLDREGFGYRWQHDDPRMDALQRAIAALVERDGSRDPLDLFAEAERLAYEAAGKVLPQTIEPAVTPAAPPRLTEDWFC
ncbi:MAG: radical SAM protein [Chloroflexota bacterium]|nr:MAG: radical SAM protein [Chloroflexota bacterium]